MLDVPKEQHYKGKHHFFMSQLPPVLQGQVGKDPLYNKNFIIQYFPKVEELFPVQHLHQQTGGVLVLLQEAPNLAK